MSQEKTPNTPNFESRRELVSHISNETLVRNHDGVTIRNVYPDNSYFPHFLYGIDVKTGEPVTIKLDDQNLPTTIEKEVPPEQEPETPSSTLAKNLFGLVKAIHHQQKKHKNSF